MPGVAPRAKRHEASAEAKSQSGARVDSSDPDAKGRTTVMRPRQTPTGKSTGWRPYVPALPADLLHALWERKQQTGIPMTKLLAEAVARYLAATEGE
jgi:hypothetical protein